MPAASSSTTGSEKSTAAEQLVATLGLPVHLVDEEIGWVPGWVQRPVEDMRRIAAGTVEEPEWVFDSAHGFLPRPDRAARRRDRRAGPATPPWCGWAKSWAGAPAS
ncbi:hypothetical protein [Tessaracoccus massiliensis]|uniref:hypothetical protein n=1 Tax=Tessaracoccus massiliensis TaxID=1522311 RepID=UPI0006935B93|nr:hypothetical protein [Tessaracoccus massiliensis]